MTAGVFADMSFEEYLAHPAISNSDAKLLLPPSCPAKFHYWKQPENIRPPKDEFDFGHAGHKFILGEGNTIVRLEFDTWSTNAAKAARSKVRAEGGIPMKAADFDRAQEMALAFHDDPQAGRLLAAGGQAETSLVWPDAETGVERRCRPDYLVLDRVGFRHDALIVDVKTTDEASDDRSSRAMADYGYYMQGAGNIDAVVALGLAKNPAFILAVVEKSPPYLVSLFQPNPVALDAGRRQTRRALELFKRCSANNEWPNYTPSGPKMLALPRWVERDLEEKEIS